MDSGEVKHQLDVADKSAIHAMNKGQLVHQYSVISSSADAGTGTVWGGGGKRFLI